MLKNTMLRAASVDVCYQLLLKNNSKSNSTCLSWELLHANVEDSMKMGGLTWEQFGFHLQFIYILIFLE